MDLHPRRAKLYDAWGNMRMGTAGDPSGRYCANLGHKQDDESGLIYMRARYYEPASGRFIKEDKKKSGINWFVYCGNDPVLPAEVALFRVPSVGTSQPTATVPSRILGLFFCLQKIHQYNRPIG